MKRKHFAILTKVAFAASTALFAGSIAQPARAVTPFEQAAYLWTQGTDTDLGGSGDWGMYKSWLGVAKLGAETDPGGWDTWSNATEGWNNNHWGDQQTKYGTSVLPDVLLSIASMPYSPHGYDTTWEGQQWQLEADNDPATMQHFVTLANNIAAWNYKSVIIRMDYEFDGGWIPYGNLNAISGMPGNFNKAWQNIVTTVRTTVKAKNPNIKLKFLWNPTDGNVQIKTADYYPGDAYVDYIGFDNYDYDYSGVYKSGVKPDAATQQKAWTNSILPRVQWFADFASAANPLHRNGAIAGRSVPMIVGEWGLWQVDSSGRPAGGDDPNYIQNMYDWMSSHNVYMESYFETPADGLSTLWPGGYPTPGSGNHSWGAAGTPYPKSAAKYRTLFSDSGKDLEALAASKPPVTPAGLTAEAGIAQVALSWYPSAGAISYNVIRGTVTGPKSTTVVASGLTDSEYTNTGLTNGTQYFYKVQAVNTAGLSEYSTVVSATPSIPVNHVTNSGFESNDLTAWTVKVGSNKSAAFTEAGGHTGTYRYANYATTPYEVTLNQTVPVPNGTHTISAWVQSGGGQAVCRMETSGYGGSPVYTNIPGAGGWTKISTTVNVTTGTLLVGFYSKATGGQWLRLDDVVVN